MSKMEMMTDRKLDEIVKDLKEGCNGMLGKMMSFGGMDIFDSPEAVDMLVDSKKIMDLSWEMMEAYCRDLQQVTSDLQEIKIQNQRILEKLNDRKTTTKKEEG